MKKAMLFLLVCLFTLVAMPAFALVDSANDGSDDAVLTLEDADTNDFDIALSPNVLAQYTVGDNAAGGSQQWWSAGTTHSGGKYTYGTAANVTKLYKQENDGDDRLDEIPQTIASESEWSANSWEL